MQASRKGPRNGPGRRLAWASCEVEEFHVRLEDEVEDSQLGLLFNWWLDLLDLVKVLDD